MRWRLRASILFGIGVFFSASVLFAPLALSATTPAAIKLIWHSSTTPTNPIFVYKKVKNPVATAITGCVSAPDTPDSSTVQCYVWKQVGFLAASTSAYVFIDPPGALDAYGKPVVYKLAQAQMKSPNNTAIEKWTGLCSLTPAKLKQQKQWDCGVGETYIRYTKPSAGKNYAVGTIAQNASGSIGIKYSLKLPTFYNTPKGQASVPLTFWVVYPFWNEPTGLYEYTSPPFTSASSAPYIPVSVEGASGSIMPLKYYTSKLNIGSSGNTASWVQKKYTGTLANPLKGIPDTQNAYIGAFKSQDFDTKISLNGKLFPTPNYYGTYLRYVFPNKPTYCVNNTSNQVKLYSADSRLVFGSNVPLSYTCPLSTGYNLQLSGYCPAVDPPADCAAGGIKKLSDLYVFRSLGNNYVTWKTIAGNTNSYTLKVAGTTHTNISPPYKIIEPLSTYQSSVNSVSVAPTQTSSAASGSQPYILRTSFTAGPITQPPAPAIGSFQYWSVTATSITFNSYHLLSIPNLTAIGYVCKSSAAPPCLSRLHHYESLQEVKNKVTYPGLAPDTKYTFSLKVSEVSTRYTLSNIPTDKATLNPPTGVKAVVDYKVTFGNLVGVGLTWNNATVTPQPGIGGVPIVTIIPSLPVVSGATVETDPYCSSLGCLALLKASVGASYHFKPGGTVSVNWISPTSVSASSISVPVYKITPPTDFSQAAGATATTAKLNWSGGKLSPTPAAGFNDTVTTVVKACPTNHTTHQTSTSLTCSQPMISGASDGSFSGLALNTKYNVLVTVTGNVSSGPANGVSTTGQPQSQSGVGTFTTKNYVMTTPPAGVTLVAGSKTATTAKISWTAAQDTPTNPNITYTAVAKPTTGASVAGTVTGTTATFTGLGVNTTYSVTVTASDNAGNTKSVTENNLFTTDNYALSAPTNVALDGTATATTAKIKWSPAKVTPVNPDAGITYKVVATSSDGGSSATKSGLVSSHYTLTGLTPNKSYTVTVTASDTLGNAPRTSAPSSAFTTDKGVVAIDTVNAATDITSHSAKISWTAGTDTNPYATITYTGVTTPSGGKVTIASAGTTATVTRLQSNVTYTVTITATDQFGSSASKTSPSFTTKPF